MNPSEGGSLLIAGKGGSERFNNNFQRCDSISSLESNSYSEHLDDENYHTRRETVFTDKKMFESSAGPRPARFNSYMQRPVPKSSEEKEEELIEYYRQHPFQANPIRFKHENNGESIPIEALLDPRPDSHLRRPLPKSSTEKEEELMEFYRQHPFRAQPIRCQLRPDLVVDSSSDEDNDTNIQPVRLTATQPNQLQSHSKDRAGQKGAELLTNIDSIFRKQNSAPPTEVARTVTVPQPFHLHADERIRKRSNCTINQQQDENPDRKSEQPKIRTIRGDDSKPFQLASVARHATHQKNFEEKVRLQQEEEKKLARFRALDWSPKLHANNDIGKKHLRRYSKREYTQTIESDIGHNLHRKLSANLVLVDTTNDTQQGVEEICQDVFQSKKSSIDTQPSRLSSVTRHRIHQKEVQSTTRGQEREQKKLSEFRALEWKPQFFESHYKQKYLRNKKQQSNPKSIECEKSIHDLSERYRSNNIGPFGLHSIKRHQTYQKEFSKKYKNDKGWNRQPSSLYTRPSSYWTSLLKQVSSGTKRTSHSTIHTTNRNATSALPPRNNQPTASSETSTKEKMERLDLINPSFVTPLIQASFEESLQSTRSTDRVRVSPISIIVLFMLLCTFRIVNTFAVRTYFDPDEFWQTMEPAYCQIFSANASKCPGFTWEWKRRAPDAQILNIIESSMLGPVRTYLSIVPVYVYYWLMKHFQMDTLWSISRGPMILNAITVAAPVDLLTWYCATWLYPRNGGNRLQYSIPIWCLFCSVTSWFNGYTLVRTFANGQETLLLILAIALVSPEFIGNVDRKYYTIRSYLCFLLGGLAVSIRFTAIAAFIPMGIILAMRCKSAVSTIGYLLGTCATFGIAGIGIAAAVDMNFFGFWTIPFLGNFHFNAILNFADLYGSHPPHWYFTSGLPAITGLLLPFVIYEFYQLTMARNTIYGQRNLWIVFLCYVTIMSFNAHKEFRFILPVLPLICILCGNRVRTVFGWNNNISSSRVLASIWITIFVGANILALLYLGLFHQLGPVAVNESIANYSKILYELNPQQYQNLSIHYLTGACHSTPLLSHLHTPPINFEDNIWHLDCSPDCRSDSSRTCEYEQFDNDPIKFLQGMYFPCSNSSRMFRNTCLASLSITPRPVPDFIVTLTRYSNQVQQALSTASFQEIARFPNKINGIRFPLLDNSTNNYIFDDQEKEFRQMKFFNDLLKISVEDVVLLSRHKQFFTDCQTSTCPNEV